MSKVRMKQKALLCSVSALILCLVTLCALPVLPVFAASETKELVTENFNNTDSDENWLANSFETYRENFSLQYGNSGFGSGMILTKYKVERSCTVSYKISVHGSGPHSGLGLEWIGLQVGLKNLSMSTNQAGAMVVSYHNGHTGLMDNENGTKPNLTNESLAANGTFPGGICTNGKNGDVACVELKLTKRGSDAANGKDESGSALYDVEYRVWKDGAARPSSALSWNGKGVSADGYLAFGGIIYAGSFVRIYDFEISEGEETVFESEFGKDIENQVGGRTAAWCARDIALADCGISADSYVNTAGVESGVLLSATQLGLDPYVNKQFDLSFDANCNNLCEGASFGVGFGLSPLSKKPDERNYIGVKGLADNKWQFMMSCGGKERAHSLIFDFYPNGIQNLKFEGYYNGAVKVTFGDKSETFGNVDFEGNFALATLGSAASGVKFDNVALSVTTQKTINNIAEDRTIDFTGIRKIEDNGAVYETSYIDSSKWHLGTNVRLARDGGKYVQFASATDTSAFGPRTRYNDFICRFGVTASQNRDVVPNGAAVGLSFGRRGFYSQNTASAGIYFEKTAEGMQLHIYNAANEQARNGIIEIPDMDIWSSNDVAKSPVTYNFMFVVRGGVADVYFAPDTADASEMEIVRATLTDFVSYGFVAIAGRGGAAFKLNNCSVINAESGKTSVASTESASARIDFTDGSLYTASSNVKTNSSGAMLSASSYVSTKAKFTNFLLYTDITAADGAVEVSFGANNTIKFTTENTIETQLTKTGGERDFAYSDFANGGIVYVEVMGNTVTVGVSARVAPEEFLHMPIAVYTCENALGEIKISAQGNAQISYANVYSLAGTIEIEPDDWEKGDGEYPVKPAPEGKVTQDEKKSGGCSGSMLGGSALIALSALGLAAVLILGSKKFVSEEKYEKK